MRKLVNRSITMRGLRRGYYETFYGNTAFCTGPNARTAKDLDSGDRVPVVFLDESSYRAQLGGERIGALAPSVMIG